MTIQITNTVAEIKVKPYNFTELNAALTKSLNEKFKELADDSVTIFKANPTEKLAKLYLDSFEVPAEKQAHNCNCCKSFLHRVGSLVYLDGQSHMLKSLVWDETYVPDEFKEVIKALRLEVEKKSSLCKIVRVNKTLGVEELGNFTHFCLKFTDESYSKLVQSTQEKSTDECSAMIKAFFSDKERFQPELVEYALNLLKHDKQLVKLDNKFRDSVETFYNQVLLFNSVKNNVAKRNLVWAFINKPNRGSLASSLVGQFLTDLSKGAARTKSESMTQTAVKDFCIRANPLNYMRPTEAPKQDNLILAAKYIKDNGLENSFKRKWLTASELKNPIWVASDVKTDEDKSDLGIFEKIVTRENKEAKSDTRIDGGTISFDKFKDVVLPTASKVFIKFEEYYQMNFHWMTTAVNAEDLPILKHDTPEDRNQVSGYFIHGGANISAWGIKVNNYHEVLGIYQPQFPNFHNYETMLLDKVTLHPDLKNALTSGLFPEVLIDGLYPFRQAVEKLASSTQPAGETPLCLLLVPEATIHQRDNSNILNIKVLDNQGVEISYKVFKLTE